MCSVLLRCSGSLLPAEAGLLRQKQATTHWTYLEHMATRYPEVQVLSDRIYVKDGFCYTAAGGTSAIDLALALVEEDLGTNAAAEAAKHLLLFLRRSSTQPQLSTTLLAQKSSVGSIGNLLVWMADNLDKDLSVSSLARRMAMSPRNFARYFVREVGRTPARHVSELRLEAARRNLADENLSLGDVARVSGFGSVEVFRRLFTKSFGASPGRYRLHLQVGTSLPITQGDDEPLNSERTDVLSLPACTAQLNTSGSSERTMNSESQTPRSKSVPDDGE